MGEVRELRFLRDADIGEKERHFSYKIPRFLPLVILLGVA
jgi:hypothetical protein